MKVHQDEAFCVTQKCRFTGSAESAANYWYKQPTERIVECKEISITTQIFTQTMFAGMASQ